jgi:hypothetical protein
MPQPPSGGTVEAFGGSIAAVWNSRYGGGKTAIMVQRQMPHLGKAALAMWWDIAPAVRAEFEDWHSHEHFPERLGIPGFLRGSRWACASGGERFFVMYELDSYETLTSPAYVARLDAPTPWSTKLFPHHRNMVRSQCRVLLSHGSAIAGAMLTVRLSPAEHQSAAVLTALQEVLPRLPGRPGLTGGHFLKTDTPPLRVTAEQKIRGGKDITADWIVLVTGYDAGTLENLSDGELAAARLGVKTATYDVVRLSFAATPRDIFAEQR